jgi:hypothetical protein
LLLALTDALKNPARDSALDKFVDYKIHTLLSKYKVGFVGVYIVGMAYEEDLGYLLRT